MLSFKTNHIKEFYNICKIVFFSTERSIIFTG